MFISSACALGPLRGFVEQGSNGKISKRKMNMFEGTREQLYVEVNGWERWSADVLNRE